MALDDSHHIDYRRGGQCDESFVPETLHRTDHLQLQLVWIEAGSNSRRLLTERLEFGRQEGS